MKHEDIMSDPFFAGVMLQIERRIFEGDEIARSRGIALTDSQVISLLTKVIGAAEGKPAKMSSSSNPKDEFLAEFCGKLNELRGSILEMEPDQDPETATPLKTADWVVAIRRVIESARLRKGSVPGSRGYLDYLGPFLAECSQE